MSEIRIAQPEDKEIIQRIYNAVVGPHADQDEARWDRFIQQGGLVVAQVESRIIGFGGIDVHAAEQVKFCIFSHNTKGPDLGRRFYKNWKASDGKRGLIH